MIDELQDIFKDLEQFVDNISGLQPDDYEYFREQIRNLKLALIDSIENVDPDPEENP